MQRSVDQRWKRSAKLPGLLLALFACTVIVKPLPALAVQPDEVLADSVLEARARALSHQLRCLVCQNQSIDDSDAPLARDLRIIVRERLVKGESDDEVKAYLVARFGDFVLLKPPFKGSTLLLWMTPLLLLGGGVLIVMRQMRKQKQSGSTSLTDDEERALSEILRTAGESKE